MTPSKVHRNTNKADWSWYPTRYLMPSTSDCVGVLCASLVEKFKRLRGFAVVSADLCLRFFPACFCCSVFCVISFFTGVSVSRGVDPVSTLGGANVGRRKCGRGLCTVSSRHFSSFVIQRDVICCMLNGSLLIC